jgi:hypothetical protein
MRRAFVFSIVTVILLAGAPATVLAFRPPATRAAAPAKAQVSPVVLGRCPKDALPLRSCSDRFRLDQRS